MTARFALRSVCGSLLVGFAAAACGSSGGTTPDAVDASLRDSAGYGQGSDDATDESQSANDAALDSTGDDSNPDSAGPDSAGDDGATDAQGDVTGEEDLADASPDGGLPDAGLDANDAEAKDAGADSGDGGAEPGDASVDAPGDARSDASADAAADARPDASDAGANDAAPEASADTGAPVCTNGQMRCVGQQPQSCAVGEWQDTGAACTNSTCVLGACQGSCAPGQTTCSGTLQPQSCSSTGAWQNNGAPCTTYCASGACVAPECRSSDGGLYECAEGQNCCGNPTTYVASCASSCSSGTSATDCAGNTGPNQCPTGTLCCGTLVLNGGSSPPNCDADSLTTSCKSSCSDGPPSLTSSCGSAGTPATYTVRMCTAKADCSGTNANCCSYNGSPLYWCVPFIDTLASGAKCM